MNGSSWDSDVMEIVKRPKKVGTKAYTFTFLMEDIYSFRNGVNFLIKNYEQQRARRRLQTVFSAQQQQQQQHNKKIQ